MIQNYGKLWKKINFMMMTTPDDDDDDDDERYDNTSSQAKRLRFWSRKTEIIIDWFANTHTHTFNTYEETLNKKTFK